MLFSLVDMLVYGKGLIDFLWFSCYPADGGVCFHWCQQWQIYWKEKSRRDLPSNKSRSRCWNCPSDSTSKSLRDHSGWFYQYGKPGSSGWTFSCSSEISPQRSGQMQSNWYHATSYPWNDPSKSSAPIDWRSEGIKCEIN